MFLAAIIYVFGAFGLNADHYLSQLPEPVQTKIEAKINQGLPQLNPKIQSRLDQFIASQPLITPPASGEIPRPQPEKVEAIVVKSGQLLEKVSDVAVTHSPVLERCSDYPELCQLTPRPKLQDIKPTIWPTLHPLPTHKPQPTPEPKPTNVPEPTFEPQPTQPVIITPIPLPSCPPSPPVNDHRERPSVIMPCLDNAI